MYFNLYEKKPSLYLKDETISIYLQNLCGESSHFKAEIMTFACGFCHH